MSGSTPERAVFRPQPGRRCRCLILMAGGYAPAAIALSPGFERAPEILAFGAEMKATFCLVKDGRAVLSQHQGDLEVAATCDDYRKNIALCRELFDHAPKDLAAVLHPEYLSTKLAAKGHRVTRVTLDVGQLAGGMADAIAFCFDIVAKGTLLDGARLEIRKIAGGAVAASAAPAFVLAMALLHMAGISIGLGIACVGARTARIAMRFCGGAMAMAGVCLLAGHL